MKSFNFKNKLELTIENKKYTIDASNTQILQAILTLTNKSLELSKKAESKNLNDVEEDINETIKICSDFVKTCLGDAAFNELFDNRVVDYTDWIELTAYITNAIAEFKTNKLEAFIS